METWQTTVAVTIGLGAVLGVLKLWVVPAVRELVHAGDAHPTLMEIADQFKPDDGASLHDRIVHIERKQDEICDGIEGLHNKVDLFVTQRMAGGMRSTDPKGTE